MTDEIEDLLLPALRKTRARIDTPDKWTKGANARTKDLQQCSYHSSQASCFCLEGALAISAHELATTRDRGLLFRHAVDVFVEAAKALKLPATKPERPAPYAINDHPNTTHANMLAALDLAIANVAAHA